MGLFDGASGRDETGSTAEIARWLDIPVLLVVDAARQARSAAALVKGFVDFDPRLHFAGVIFNNVASANHAELLREALASAPGLPPLLGCLARDPQVALPERHLGLLTAEESGRNRAFFDALADWFEAGVDIEGLLTSGDPPAAGAGRRASNPKPRGVRIGVARDEAFCFYYPENLEALEAAPAPNWRSFRRCAMNACRRSSMDSTSAAAIPRCTRHSWRVTPACVTKSAAGSRRGCRFTRSAAG